MTQSIETRPKQLPIWVSLLAVVMSLAIIGGSVWWYLRTAARSPDGARQGTARVAPARQAQMNELWTAIERGDLPTMQKLVEADGSLVIVRNPEFYHATPLHFASWHGNATIVKFLLDRGADPNAVERQYNGTPVSWAIVAGQKEIVKLLLEHGGRSSPDFLGIAEAGKRGDFQHFAPNPPAAYDAIITLLKGQGS